MVAWSNGYVGDIPYTHGFFRRTSAAHLRLTAATRGLSAPTTDAIAYAELGCGQGFGTALLAAANPDATVYGFDFNPEQVAHARDLCDRAGLRNATFEEISFEELSTRPRGELPDFDVVTLHGVYSWISPEARAAIVGFLRTKLKPGGLVYVSYNAMPGCAGLQPLQRLLRDEAGRLEGSSDKRVKEALGFVQDLAARNFQFFKDHPATARRLDLHGRQSTTYLAHEYLNGHWNPLHFADVVRELEAAKLGFVGSARLVENDTALALPQALQAFIDGIEDPIRRETLKDYWANRPFRVDVFQKGRMRLPATLAVAALRAQAVGLRVARDKVDLAFTVGAGRLTGREEMFAPLLDRLADGPATIGELEAAVRGQANLATVMRIVTLLDATDQLCAARLAPADSAPALRLNRAVAERWDGPYRFVAAPVLGSALEASSDDLLFLRHLLDGVEPTPEALAAAALGELAARVSAKAEASDRERLVPAVRERATRFVETVLPVWRAAGAVGEAPARETSAPRIAAVG